MILKISCRVRFHYPPSNSKHSTGIWVWVKGVKAASFLQDSFPFFIPVTVLMHTFVLGLKLFQSLHFFMEDTCLHELEDYHLCLFQVSEHDRRGTLTITTPTVNLRAIISQRFVVCPNGAHP